MIRPYLLALYSFHHIRKQTSCQPTGGDKRNKASGYNKCLLPFQCDGYTKTLNNLIFNHSCASDWSIASVTGGGRVNCQIRHFCPYDTKSQFFTNSVIFSFRQNCIYVSSLCIYVSSLFFGFFFYAKRSPLLSPLYSRKAYRCS